MKAKMTFAAVAVLAYSAAGIGSAMAATGQVAIGDMTLVQEKGSIAAVQESEDYGHHHGHHHFGDHHHFHGHHHGGLRANKVSKNLPTPKDGLKG